MSAPLRVGDLFSGIGGFSLAAESVGWETVFFSEVDRYASAVLAARFPSVPNLGDITAIDWSTAPAVDVLVGGFPCQDISNAGKRIGISGARSGLWTHYARAIRHLRPRYVLVENVSALLTRGLEHVLRDLAQLGYDASWEMFSAADVGAPHLRERVWIVAAPSPFPDALELALRLEWEREREQHPQPRPAQPRDDGSLWLLADADELEDGRLHAGREDETGTAELAGCGATLADTDRAGLQLHQKSDSRRKRATGRDPVGGGHHGIIPDAGGAGLPVPQPQALRPAGRREERRAITQRDWWAIEPHVGRVAHGIPARVDRLKCLGNAIVPACAAAPMRAIEATR